MSENVERPMFLQNAWYVAGFGSEIGTGEMRPIRILDCAILLLRRTDGSLAALVDRCPHRFAPLSLGHFDGVQVTCGYHGLGFDGNGACSQNPHGPTAGLKVQAWPVREHDGLIWVWPGEADAAEAVEPPRFAMLDEATAHVNHGYLHGRADYRLMIDNILDLSHIEFLHPALGTPEVRKAKIEVTTDGDVITVSRAMNGETLSEGLAHVYGAAGQKVDRTLTVAFNAPSNLVLTVRIEREQGRTGSQSLHLFTPETATSTHYFYTSSMWREDATREQFDAFAGALTRVFLNEDKPMIDAQQERIGNREIGELKPALLKIDKGAVLARRKLEQMIAREAEEHA
ncbi:aromatic ring-hydroxylating dioxygenase subunit alpha [Novosphingobium sp. KN65.2]|uniref:aromatic ring-hydroxylating dioxygenase subunit alpha n=1 Tax=Novosphingobium sp. KN65.2 TaxID=1478134 RepID=UPI0005DE9D81|nr:aromatic ring-hydroxylating dioxygenase subunit alpha [Novosphingobium sp. KN65.2]CDO34234.1 Vanillate monooxygenase [Novosphingobium sp. KN65.2]